MLRRRFRVSGATTAVSARAVAAAPGRGTAFRYTLSAAARVSFRIDRLLSRRRVRRQGTLVRRVRAGRRSTPFSGRIARRPLAPGRYRVTLRATDSAGDVSRGRTITFAVVAG
jgi:hypothetical protein